MSSVVITMKFLSKKVMVANNKKHGMHACFLYGKDGFIFELVLIYSRGYLFGLALPKYSFYVVLEFNKA